MSTKKTKGYVKPIECIQCPNCKKYGIKIDGYPRCVLCGKHFKGCK